MRSRLWLSILTGMLVLVAVLGWHVVRRRAAPASRAEGVELAARAEAPAVPAIHVQDVAAPPAPAAPEAPAADKEPELDLDALAAKPSRPTAILQAAGGLSLHRIDGFSLVHLGGGAPAIRPFGGRGKEGKRRIRGRVIGLDGKPVSGAVVLADKAFNIDRDTMMTLGGAVSDGAGAFEIDDAPPGPCAVIAIVGDDWTGIADVTGDDAGDLRVRGHGSLSVRASYDGGPETFRVLVASPDRRISGRFQTGADGALNVRSLPPGRLGVDVGLAQAMGGGVSKSATRQVTVENGEATEVEVAIASGTTVEVTAVPPPDSEPKGITYWLFTGAAPSDGLDATARKTATQAPSMTVGGAMKKDPVEFHDVVPGTYWACAGFFDVTTMGAFARPFGCTRLEVRDGDTARDVSVPLS